jgi:hypothetical protein
VNVRPDLLSTALTRATAMVPDFILMRHLASVAARTAFVLPDEG